MSLLSSKNEYLCDMKSNYGTILVVDDNPAILTATKICLAGTFERILTFSLPAAVLTTLQQEHVDVILLDMNFSLGVNSGQEGMIWLSAIHRRHPDIPVVLMTDGIRRCETCRERIEEWCCGLRHKTVGQR